MRYHNTFGLFKLNFVNASSKPGMKNEEGKTTHILKMKISKVVVAELTNPTTKMNSTSRPLQALKIE